MLHSKVLMELVLHKYETCENKCNHKPVKVFFRYTSVIYLSPDLVKYTSRKAMLFLPSCSAVNSILACLIVKYFKKICKVFILKDQKQSSTYLLYIIGWNSTVQKSNNFFSWYQRNTLVNVGHTGDPITTPSICLYKLLLKMKTGSLIAGSNTDLNYGAVRSWGIKFSFFHLIIGIRYLFQIMVCMLKVT